MAITIKAHGKRIGNAAMVRRLNQIQGSIYAARDWHEKENFEYWSGVYDGYREALAAMGYSVVYSDTNEIIGIEAR